MGLGATRGGTPRTLAVIGVHALLKSSHRHTFEAATAHGFHPVPPTFVIIDGIWNNCSVVLWMLEGKGQIRNGQPSAGRPDVLSELP